METMETPQVPTDLLEWLEASYPPFIPQPSETHGETLFQAGMVALVRKLRLIHTDQHTTERE